MGLDVTFYQEVEMIDDCKEEDCWPNHDSGWLFNAGPGQNFPATQWEFLDGPQSFCFKSLGQEVRWQESYSGYSIFRKHLSRSAGYNLFDEAIQEIPETFEAEREVPFLLMVWFADNEGTFGPKVAQSLLQDFEQYRDKFVKHVTSESNWIDANWWIDSYDGYTEGLKIVGPKGLVKYH